MGIIPVFASFEPARPALGDYASVIVGQYPFAYYRLDETSGTVAKDQMGSFDANYQGGVVLGQPPALISEPQSTSADFYFSTPYDAGANKHVQLPPGMLALASTGFSFSCWARTNPNWPGYGYEGIFLFGTRGGGERVWLAPGITGSGGAGVQFGIATGGTTQMVDTTSVRPLAYNGDHAWHHIAVTADGMTARIYVDGVQKAQAPMTLLPYLMTTPGSWLAFNVGTGSYDGGFPGWLDECAFWFRALTSQEVLAQYKAGGLWPQPTQGVGLGDPYEAAVLADNPTVHFPLNEPAGSTAIFSAPAGVAATLNGIWLGQRGPMSGGKSAQLTGGGAYTTAAVAGANGGFTMECWAYRHPAGNSAGSNANNLLNLGGSAWVGIDDAGGMSFSSTFMKAFAAAPSGTLPAQQWAHVMATYSGGVASLYVNGVLVASSAGGSNFSTTPKVFYVAEPAHPPAANVAHAAYYNHALPAGAAAAHYSAAFPS